MRLTNGGPSRMGPRARRGCAGLPRWVQRRRPSSTRIAAVARTSSMLPRQSLTSARAASEGQKVAPSPRFAAMLSRARRLRAFSWTTTFRDWGNGDFSEIPWRAWCARPLRRQRLPSACKDHAARQAIPSAGSCCRGCWSGRTKWMSRFQELPAPRKNISISCLAIF